MFVCGIAGRLRGLLRGRGPHGTRDTAANRNPQSEAATGPNGHRERINSSGACRAVFNQPYSGCERLCVPKVLPQALRHTRSPLATPRKEEPGAFTVETAQRRTPVLTTSHELDQSSASNHQHTFLQVSVQIMYVFSTAFNVTQQVSTPKL